jgi:hypothetical protein
MRLIARKIRRRIAKTFQPPPPFGFGAGGGVGMTGGAVNTGGGGWVGGIIGGGGVEGGLAVSSISFTRVRVVQNGAMGKLIAGAADQGKLPSKVRSLVRRELKFE